MLTKVPPAPRDASSSGVTDARAHRYRMRRTRPATAAMATLGRVSSKAGSNSVEHITRVRETCCMRPWRQGIRVGRRTRSAVGAGLILLAVATAVAVPRHAAPSLPPVAVREWALRDSFDSSPIGGGTGWDVARSRDDAGMAEVAPVPTSSQRSARLQLGIADQSVSACRNVPVGGSGTLRAEALVLLDGFGRNDTPILSIRSTRGEVAAVRIGSTGEVRIGDATRPGPPRAITANTWYTVVLDLDLSGRMYALSISRQDPPAVVTEQSGLGARLLLGDPDRVCFSAPLGVAGRSLYVRTLEVTARL